MSKNSRKAVFFQKYAMPLILLALILILQLAFRNINLLSWNNIKTIILQTSVLGLIALGLSFVMIAGETDISFAGTIGMMGAVFTILTSDGWSYAAALAVTILIGAALGLTLSLIVTKGHFSGFIVSIAFMFMGLGVERTFNEGITIWLENESVQKLGRFEIAGIYMFGWTLFILFIIAYFAVKKTKYGFWLKIIGENREAGLEAGIKSDRIKIAAFILAGALYGLAACREPIRFGGAIVGAGQSYMLPAMAACYLGSTMFTPGHVNIAGTLIGAFFTL